MWFFHSDFFSLGKVPSILIRVGVEPFHIDHWSADDMDWFVSSVLPSTHRGQPPTDSQNFILDPLKSFGKTIVDDKFVP